MKWAGHMAGMKDERLPERAETKNTTAEKKEDSVCNIHNYVRSVRE